MTKRFFSLVTNIGLFTVVTLASQFSYPQESTTVGGEAELYVPFPIENAISDGERARIRSVELTAQTKLDSLSPALRGKLTIGADDVSGALVLNLREGILQIPDLCPGLNARFGKFFLPVGILNQTRKSAWAFSSSPIAFARFFSDTGVADTGFDLNYRFSPNAQLRAGVTDGYRYDSSISNGGTRPMTPTHFLRPEISFGVGESHIAVGLNYLSRIADTGELMRVSGLDLGFLPQTPNEFSWSAQAEYYLRGVSPVGLPQSEDTGGYVYVEKGLGARFASGLRIDQYQIRSLTDSSGNYRPNQNLALAPVFTYRGRDHLRFVASYTYLRGTQAGTSDRAEQTLEFRLVTELGTIPKFRGLSDESSSL